MLDQETKRKIDSARQILVGKVPDPKAQVEQITTAMIYKFMDDMDKQAEELGGKASFFTNGFEQYSWSKLMGSKLGGRERLDLYDEAIKKMSQNQHIPQLFRDIFKDAFLPYRSPETLSLFLKEINEFSYDNSENLGNAYEYLLSIMSAQGDAGQFRTPRHIIDFINEVIDPKKDETILDPACGTAGFLISAYKHILSQHDGKDNQTGKSTNKEKFLSPADKKKMMNNLVGYDISPDMVRMSLVNMYLHGFQEPKIFEYDTLSSEERWDEQYDVIMANPPFMSPKGGIRPHKRFSVQANRAEVLFVDYILEHLNQKGRAGIIVPEGIIFKSDNAYKKLRQMLVEDGLFAVVSLPAGVFQPYSGVKTSILFFDNELAKKAEDILFIKISDDGFGLGATRRQSKFNDLPHAIETIDEYKKYVLEVNQKEIDRVVSENGSLANVVEKSEIAENGDYNLSGDRYKIEEVSTKDQKWPMVELGKICDVMIDGNWIESKDQSQDGIRLVQTGNVGKGEYLDKKDKARYISEETFKRLKCTEILENDLLISRLPDPVGRACLLPKLETRAITAVDCTIIRTNKDKVIPKFLLYTTTTEKYYNAIFQYLTGSSRKRISRKNLEQIKIPLPPLEVQKEILEQIEGWQKIVDGIQLAVSNWKPIIDIDSEWKKKKISEIAELEYGIGEAARDSGEFRYIRITDIAHDGFLKNTDKKYIAETEDSKKYQLKKGDVLVARTGATFGKTVYFDEEEKSVFAGFLIRFNFNKKKIDSKFFWCYAQSEEYWSQAKSLVTGGGQPQFNANAVGKIAIPLPSLEIQKQIVEQIEEQRVAIEQAKNLKKIFEQKIKEKIGEVWGE